MTTIHVKNVDVSKITFAPAQPFKSGKGGKMSYINYGGVAGKFTLQSPPVTLPYGISSFDKENGDGHDVFVEVSFAVPPTDDDLGTLYEKFTKIDEAILGAAKDNAASWGLPMNKSLDQYSVMCTGGLVREKKDGIRKIVFKIDERAAPGVFEKKEVEDDEGNKATKNVAVEGGLKSVAKGSVVDMTFEMPYVWANGGKFGVKLAVQAIRVLNMGSSGDATFVD